jgi:hypothetical protein
MSSLLARHRDRLRKARRLRALQTVQRLIVKQHRDAEPGVRLHPPLNRVRELGGRPGIVVAARPLDPADPDLEPRRQIRVREAAIRIAERLLPVPDAHHLGHLLLERHPPEQILDPPLDRQIRVHVRRVRVRRLLRRRGSRGSRKHCRAAEDGARDGVGSGSTMNPHAGLVSVCAMTSAFRKVPRACGMDGAQVPAGLAQERALDRASGRRYESA